MHARLLLLFSLLMLASATGQSKPATGGPLPEKAQVASAGRNSGTATVPEQAQLPATAPQVSYKDGLLTIYAENAALGDVLRAVQRATGAVIDTPGYASDRVYVRLGPGEPRDVLASLLNGSRYDFVLVGTPQQPNGVGRVMLMIRQNFSEPTAPAAVAGNTPPNPAAHPPPAEDEDNEPTDAIPDRAAEPTTPAVPPEPEPSGQPPAGEGAPPQPIQGQSAPAQPAPGQPAPGQQPGAVQSAPNPSGQQVKTPEQLLQQLQQLQQQYQNNQTQNPQ